MTGTNARPWLPLVVGAAVVTLNVAVAMACLYATTGAEHLRTSVLVDNRNIRVIPYVVLALSLLVVGLVARRWWQAFVAPVVLVAGGVWWENWVMTFPQRIADNDWSGDRADEVFDRLSTTWDVVAMVVVIGGWGLVRRTGWWWALGLLPSLVVVGIAQVVKRALEPESFVTSGSEDDFFELVSRSIREYGTIDTTITALTVVGCVWLCVLAERLLPGRLRSEPLPAPAYTGNVGYVPPQNSPAAPAAPAASVADELRKLADLRDAGVLTQTEFEAQKSHLLG